MAGPTQPDDLSGNPSKELLRRFLVTFFLGVVVFRLGSFISIPGVDASVLRHMVSGSGDEGALAQVIRFADMFNGGAIQNASIFGLGITPYISASIILQLLTFSIPSLKALQKEGESGRRKLNQYTRYMTLIICIVQSAVASIALKNLHSDQGNQLVTWQDHPLLFTMQASLVITTGSMLILWIAEQITKFGIGNGVSVIIMIGILASLQAAFRGEGGADALPHYLGIACISLAIIAGIVVVVQAVRRIHLEQQRRIQGNKVYGGAQTTLPLKLNQANVIPVIFASPIMAMLGLIAANLGKTSGVEGLFSYGQPLYRYIFATLIIGFTYFYISITFDLFDLSNHFKQAGFFIKGVKPGKNTVDYLSYHLKRITFIGAIFLAVIAILPELLESSMGLSGRGGRMLMGGTGLLIVVGVSLDIMQKVGAFFLAHQYRGLGGLGDDNTESRKSGKRF